jgi:hypothetical protein
MDSKVDQPLLDPNQRMPEFVSTETKQYHFQEPKMIEHVEHIELRDADIPVVTTTDGGQTETLQVTTETTTTEKHKGKKCKIIRNRQECQPLSIGLNTYDRDEKAINGQVHIMFDDVIAEPDGSHSFENVWRGNYVIFHYTKIWMYQILTTIFGWPLSFICGIIFAVVTAFNNFIFTPFFKLFALVFFWVGKLWGTMFHEIVDPIFESFGQCFSNIRYTPIATPAVTTTTQPGKNFTTTGTNGGVVSA